MLKEEYIVKEIDYNTAEEMVLKYHYLHRKSPYLIAFGLFRNDDLKGVIIYGIPPSRALQVGVCGKDNADYVMELNRLWVNDDVPANGESFFISQSLKMLRESKHKERYIIISYADTSQNHIGIVYQSTNWIYTGLSDKHVQWNINGMDFNHSRHIFDEYGGVNKAKQFFGNDIIRSERPRKHRYVYFNCGKVKRKILKKKLKYQIQEYPKNNLTTE